jgi:hypothetical protein
MVWKRRQALQEQGKPADPVRRDSRGVEVMILTRILVQRERAKPADSTQDFLPVGEATVSMGQENPMLPATHAGVAEKVPRKQEMMIWAMEQT